MTHSDNRRVRNNLGKFTIILGLAVLIWLVGKYGNDDGPAKIINFTPSDRTATAPPHAPDQPNTGTEGDQLDLNGTTILVGRIWTGDTDILGDRTCAPVAYRNMSDSDIQVAQYDWKLTTPQGLTLDATVGGATKMLPWGTIQPRGSAEGHVCFAAKFQNVGRWTLTYQPSMWSSDKLTWTNQ